MPLATGARLGPYEIVSLIGKGGMGEVYRARDTKLDRDVAIKVLPEELAADTERGARFGREAKLVASLNHPNIGGIYGLEESGGVKALVLELVEGPTLADRIAQGPIPIDEALPIARQIAEALEAGHEAGIVHRDLKPANVKVKEDGTVKVLDYGLAKGIENDAPNGGDSELSQSPTLTRQGTQLGVILGTAPYMSPEQARGKRVDKRTDIFAFGAVVYEMLTGKRAFAGEDVSETLAHVMMKDPDWEALPPATPGALRQVLRLCLTKDARERVRDIADVRLAMGGAFETETEAKSQPRVVEPARWRPFLLGALVGALALAAAASVVVWNLEPEMPRPVTRFTIPLPGTYTQGARRGQLLALSPDGRRVAFSVAGQLYIRDMDQTEMTPIPGAEGAVDPFFSPDGASLGFWSEGEIKKASLASGATVTLCKAQILHGVRWEADDTIVFGQASGIYRVSANGGTAELLVPMEGTGKVAHGPQVLPGGKALLLTLGTSGNWDDAEIVVHSLETDESKVVVERGRDARYVPSGHLVYFMDGTLMAVPFDVDALEVTGGAVPIAENIEVPFSTTASAFFGVSDSGSLVYAENVREDRRTLVWVDRDGKEEALATTPRAYAYPRISPDGSRVALQIDDGNTDIWIWDFARETLTRFTFDPATDTAPIWTPDGQQIVFESHREGDGSVFMKPARGTGAAVRLTRDPRHQTPLSISPDGTSLLIEDRGASVQYDVALVALPGGGAAELLVHSEFNETDAAFAPDGRFFAYASDESGRYEVYVRPFPNVEDGLWQVSRDGGVQPLWSRDGHELFYASPDGKLMGLSVRTGDDFTYGNPEVVVATPHAELRPSVVGYDISPDGRRFLMLEDVESSTTELFVVLNWAEELRRAASTGN